MATRTGLRFPLVAKCPEEGVWFGHPCGSIAPMGWLARRPAMSVKVSRFMVGDAGGSLWNRASFAYALWELQEAGGKLCRDGRRLVKWWVNAGRPAPWVLDRMIREGAFGSFVPPDRVLNKIVASRSAADLVNLGCVERTPVVS